MSLVLFYDGDCALCSRSVHWVFEHDRTGGIEFASLQGALSSRLGLEHHAGAGSATMVLWDEGSGRKWTRSDAVLELLRVMPWPWRAFRIFILVPRSLRDALYDWVARHRHRLPTGGRSCSLPPAELRRRQRD